MRFVQWDQANTQGEDARISLNFEGSRITIGGVRSKSSNAVQRTR